MKISIVSYLNSAPLVYGIRQSNALHDCQILLDVPAIGAEKLKSDETDIALVPVGAFSQPGQVNWIGNFCIGVEGPVRSVCLFSEVPLEKIKRVWLDSHSQTSIRLIRILAQRYWNLKWQYVPAKEGFENEVIKGADAGVCIGDKVFTVEHRYTFKYDLAEEWIRFTGLPFVFAAWASKKQVDSDLISRLDAAQLAGIKAIPGIARDWSQKVNLSESEIRDYLNHNISYPFTREKKEGMELFHSFIRDLS